MNECSDGDDDVEDSIGSSCGGCRGNINGFLNLISNTPQRRAPAMIRWLVAIVGAEHSKIGRIIIATLNVTREILLRSIGAASLILTGDPTQLLHRIENCSSLAGVEGSSADLYNPLINGLGGVSKSYKNEDRIPRAKEEMATIMDVETIKRDVQQIDHVLSYWFGQTSPDGAQKSLWMIASSSAELLNRVDADISDKFTSLVILLSCNRSSVADKYDENDTLSRWTGNDELFGWQGKMAAIIVLDQLSRHIHRHCEMRQRDGNDYDHLIIPQQQHLDRIAYDIAKKMQQEHKRELATGIIPLPMRIFGIMPLRHASNVLDLSIVQQDVEAASVLHEEMDRMIRRFRKATNRRMAALQDEGRREGKLGVSCDGDGKETERGEDEQQILECFPFEADMSNARDHVVVKTISAFLCKMNILHFYDGFKISRESPSSRCCSKEILSTTSHHNDSSSSAACMTPNEVPTAIVSLSGGVDSMVIASSLAYLRDIAASRSNKHPDAILRIVAIHIDYGNRPESTSEAMYVEKYCRALGAKFVCRKIGEVTRGVTARDDYERIAREIRFDLYRQCCAEASNGTKEDGIGVMLGHHRGDLRENVISNAHKGCGPLDLSGMTSVSRNDGVSLFRPLLSLEKTHIYDYSHKFGVPYFKDTTPHWSTRGKLRNRLLPLLEEIYGEGSMDNISSLAEESDAARALVQETVTSPFMQQIKRHPMGITFETSQWKDCGLFFWKFVLRQAVHSSGLGMFSDKSVDSFLDRVSAKNVREGWLQCRKDYAVFLRKDGRVFVFYPRSFPFGNGQKTDQYDKTIKFLGYGRHVSIGVGPWTISSEIIKASDEVANKLLNTKALRSMDHLMDGDIQYYLNVPALSGATEPRPLVRVAGFTKPTRPAAWKGFDLKVESTLPLLGVDPSVMADADISGHEEYDKNLLVRVHLFLNSQETNNCIAKNMPSASELSDDGIDEELASLDVDTIIREYKHTKVEDNLP